MTLTSMRNMLVGAAIGGLLAASVAAAQASIVNVTFTGVVDGGFGDANPGDPFSLNISYESTTPNLGDATFGIFNALISLNLTAGTFVATSPAAAEIQIDNNPGGGDHDRFAVVSRASDGLTGTNSGIPVEFFFLRLDDSTDTVFSTANVLPTTLNLSSFDSNSFGIFFQGVDNSISGHITGISSVSAVPGPIAGAGLPGLIAGWMGLIAWRRKRQRAAAAA